MAHLPSFEEILTEVHSRLGLKTLPNKGRFTSYKLEIGGHTERVQYLLQGIYDALELDSRSRDDANGMIGKLAGILKAIELRTWTGNASQQQVLWHLLASVHVPMWARNLAFWSLANIEHDLPPIDAGMPGGEFWFFPSQNAQTGEITLPVPKVLHWLLDLLDEPPVETLRDAIGNKQLREKEGGNEGIVRTLRNWLSGTVPKSQNKIEEVFPDNSTLIFSGAFHLNPELSPDLQFEQALEFVRDHKTLNAAQLSEQIPMTPERLYPVFEGTACEEEKATFVRHVSVRFAPPSMATIRQRIGVARMVQEGYQDLVQFMCPDLPPTLANNPKQNKVLQLIGVFETIYNKTIQAWHHGNTELEQDAWFEQQFSGWDKYDLLLTIMSSIDWRARVSIVSERLTRRFMTISPTDALQDILPACEEDIKAVLQPRIEFIQKELEEDKRLNLIRERLKTGSPYRTLQKEDSFWVLSQLAQTNELPEKIRQMVLMRMTEVANTPLERGSYRLIQLGELMSKGSSSWPKDISLTIQQQLDAAEADSLAWEMWKAPMLRFKAKHALFENRLDSAEALYKEALKACAERAFGELRGEIAHEAFAVSITRSALNRERHESYYRNMLHFTEFPGQAPSFEDTATECENFFSTTLYHPYPGFKAIEGAAHANYRSTIEKTFGLIEMADWDGYRAWLAENEKVFHQSDLKDARRNSVLMSSLKWLYELEDRLPTLRSSAPSQFLAKIEQHLLNRRKSIHILVDAWPKQAMICDFKGQTPLMMAANHGDIELTDLLAPLSDIDAQDYLGRTALHASIAGRSLDCLKAVLEQSPDVCKVTEFERNTAAHTAVRFGWCDGLQLLLDEYPGLVGVKNHAEQHPIDMARELLEHYQEWESFMNDCKGRHVGTKANFESALSLLEECILR